MGSRLWDLLGGFCVVRSLGCLFFLEWVLCYGSFKWVLSCEFFWEVLWSSA